MSKIIRRAYRRDISFGVMVIIFAVVYFLAGQLFETSQSHLSGYVNLTLGKFLVCIVVQVMVFILWEEILFHVHIKPIEDGLVFRNHETKLKFQILIYLMIPAIITFLYLTYEVSAFRFFSWAAVCAILPVAAKLRTGITNYNDFLKLTGKVIEYKNNRQQGTFPVPDIQRIHLIKDHGNVLHKVSVYLKSGNSVTIDLDEMELEDFYEAINEYIVENYSLLLTERVSTN